MLTAHELSSSASVLRSALTEFSRARDGGGQYAPEDQQDPSAFKKAYSNRWKIAASIAALGIGGAATLAPRMERFGGAGIMKSIVKAGDNRAKRTVVTRNRRIREENAPPRSKGPAPSIGGSGKSGLRKGNNQQAQVPKQAPARKPRKKKEDTGPSIEGSGKGRVRKNKELSADIRITQLASRISGLMRF